MWAPIHYLPTKRSRMTGETSHIEAGSRHRRGLTVLAIIHPQVINSQEVRPVVQRQPAAGCTLVRA
jgi:hypothetical protein